MKKKMIAIDGNSIIHRSFHALPPFKTPDGELVNAVYGFYSTLINIFSNIRPQYVTVSFDVAKKTFRHKKYTEYKAGRKKAPDELYEQFGRTKEILGLLEIPIFEMEGFEADDVLATLADKVHSDPDVELYIITSDKDAFQLVKDDVFVLSPRKGGSDNLLYDRAAIHKRYGLTTEQMIDLKALMGDSSDNIPGVMGIGEKGAINLLQKYRDLDGVYEHLDEITGAMHRKLDEGKDDAYFSQDMVTLRHDVPIEFELEKLEFEMDHFERVEKLFGELNFKSLLTRIQKLLNPGSNNKKIVQPVKSLDEDKKGPIQTSLF